MLPDGILNQIGVFTRRSLLSPEQCREWRGCAVRGTGREAGIYKDGRSIIDETARRVKEVGLTGQDKDRFTAQIEPLRDDLERHFGTALGPLGEQQCLYYKPGDHFAPHHDSSEPEDGVVTDMHRRFVTVLVYLNAPDDPEVPYRGGELTIYGLMDIPDSDLAGFTITPELGLLVAFRSNVLHGVSPVSFGDRYMIAGWFHDQTIPDPHSGQIE